MARKNSMDESAGSQLASGQLSSSELAERTQFFTGRAWVFEELSLWMEADDGRAFVLTGGPGTGKSAIAARLAQMSSGSFSSDVFPNLGHGALAYAHFCRALDVSQDPVRFVEGLSASLATHPAFAEALLEATGPDVRIEASQQVTKAESGARVTNVLVKSLHVGNISPRIAFDRTVRKPLEGLYASGFDHQLLVLVDGLDEALTYTPEDNLVSLLGDVLDHDAELPGRVRFIICTRPDPRVLAAVGQASIDLDADAPTDVDDVRDYAFRRLTPVPEPARTEVAARVADSGQGNFLYARYVVDSLLAGPKVAAIDPLTLSLPKGLEGHYRDFLSRELTRNRERWEDRYRPLLGALAVARGAGLTASQAAQIIELSEDRAHDALQACAQYLTGPDSLSRYRIYHQSFREFLLGDPVYRVFPAVANERIATYLLARCEGAWETCQDDYVLTFTTTHLAEAIRLVDDSVKRARLASGLMSLLRDSGFLKALDQGGTAPTPVSDLEQGLVALANDKAPPMVLPVIDSALSLTALRRHYLQPEQVIEFARAGDLEAVERRLESFPIDQAWRQAVFLTSVWLSADVNRPAAAAALRRLRSSLLGYDPLSRLAQRVAADVLQESVIPSGLPPPPPLETAQQIVARMGGIDPRTHPSMLWEYDLPPGEQLLPAGRGLLEGPVGRGIEQVGDYEPIFAAEVEGPLLVSFAVASPESGDQLVREYIRLHAANTYVSYRNRSLWALLRSIVQHPSQAWVKAMVVEVAVGALAGDTLEFDECLGLAWLALCAEAGDAESSGLLGNIKLAEEYAARGLSGRALAPGFDSWGEHKRRLGALGEAFSVALRDRMAGAAMVELAFDVPYGFAGYSAPACLTLAESAVICLDDASRAVTRALHLARSSAHNVQDPVFCARTTSRWNAMALAWWQQEGGRLTPLDIADVVNRFTARPGAPEFSPFHVVGETYEARSADPASVPMPEYIRNAATLAELANRVYEYPLSEFLRLNEGRWNPNQTLPPGSKVLVPDPWFAPLLAARLAAEALSSQTLPAAERRSLIQQLVPIAAGSPTCLDTVLARLLLAARPSGQVLQDLREVLARYPKHKRGEERAQERLEVLLGRLYPQPGH